MDPLLIDGCTLCEQDNCELSMDWEDDRLDNEIHES